jgi:S-adenosylmethionine-dependent methyltransferase
MGAREDPFAGKAEWFDRQYAETSHGRVRLDLVVDRLVKRLPAAPASILDVGGGTGAFAIPLAAQGHEVTIIDRSSEWLEVARDRAREASVDVRLVQGSSEDAHRLLDGEAFDAILCHTILLYLEDPVASLTALRGLSHERTVLSVLEKNRQGLAMRPGLAGDYEEARRVLDDPTSSGRLGIGNRARSSSELHTLLLRAGWVAEDWIGVRLFADLVLTLDVDAYPGLLELERAVSRRDPYRRVARMIHLLARPVADPPESLEMIQARSFARASRATLRSWPLDKALSGPELAAFLSEPRYAAVATSRGDGRPHMTMSAYRVRHGRVWLPTVAGATRAGNLVNEPFVTVLVSEGAGDDHVVVMLEGMTIVHDRPGEILSSWLREEWFRTYGTELDWARRIIEVVPTKVFSYSDRSRE